MRSILSVCIALITLIPAQSAFAGGKKPSAAAVSFHLETGPEDNPKSIFTQAIGGKTRYFKRSPEISSKDIDAFGPFPADDQSTYGVAFRLKNGPKIRLAAITAANPGKYLLAVVNGRVVDAVLIDREVTDGCLVIWKGVALAETKEFDKAFVRIGADKNAKKKK